MSPTCDSDVPPGIVFWITGLSSAGKSENAGRIARYLRQRGRPCIILDGDELRAAINAQKCFTREDRVRLGYQYCNLCKLISSQGVDVIVATIALYSEIHEWKEANLASCCTIFLDVPIEELRRRDPKKIYARYFANELSNVAGLDLPVDLPKKPDIHSCWQEGMDSDKVWETLEREIGVFIRNNTQGIKSDD